MISAAQLVAMVAGSLGKEVRVDVARVDTLAKILATTALTRGKALRGLVASAAALAGLTLAPKPGTAKKKREKERKVCVCGADGAVGSCRTKKVKADKVKKLLRRNPCASKGKCQGRNPCAPSCPSGQKLCAGTCIASGLCCNNAECPADRPICYKGSCDPCIPVYYGSGASPDCEASEQCCGGTVSGVPAVCCEIGTAGRVCWDFLSSPNACAPANVCPPQEVNCAGGKTCVNGACV